MLPIPDRILVIKVTGQTFKEALENAVSKWPGFDGRWACVSGASFKFNPENHAGKRIAFEDINTLSGPLNPTKVYKVALKSFIAKGKDGYDCLPKGTIEFVIDEERALLFQDIITAFFDSTGPKEQDVPMDKKRLERYKLFNMEERNRTECGYLKVNVRKDGRIVNLQPQRSLAEEANNV